MGVLIAFPILGLLVILQTSIASRILLLHGTVDLILLAIIAWSLQKRVETAWQWAILGGVMITVASALPLGVALIAYALSTAIAIFFKRQIWRVPILPMLVVTFIGTMITHLLSIIALRIIGNPIPIDQALIQITLPSMILNIIAALPVYALVSELALFVYPEPIEL